MYVCMSVSGFTCRNGNTMSKAKREKKRAANDWLTECVCIGKKTNSSQFIHESIPHFCSAITITATIKSFVHLASITNQNAKIKIVLRLIFRIKRPRERVIEKESEKKNTNIHDVWSHKFTLKYNFYVCVACLQFFWWIFDCLLLK